MSLDKIFSERNTTILASIIFLAFLVYRISLIFFQFPDAGGVEGNVVYFIQRLLDGQSLYTDPEMAPFSIAQYSPFYYYIVAAIAKLSGNGPDDILALFVTGRIISLVFNLAFIFVVYLTAKNIFKVSTGRRLIASFLAFIFLEITSFARPDALYHFFYMLSLYFFMSSQKEENFTRRKGRIRIILAAVLAVIALFSKQSGITLLLIMAGWLLWKRYFRLTFLFSTYYLITFILFIALIHYINGIDLFYKNAIQGVDNGISPGWFREVIIDDFYLKFGLILIPLFLMIVFVLKKEGNSLLRFSLFLIISQYILMNILAIKNGSNPGYFTEWWTMIFILNVYYWEKLVTTIPVVSKILVSAIFFVIILKGIFITGPLKEKISAMGNEELPTVYKRDRVIADKIMVQLKKEDRYTVFLNFNTAESYLSNMLFRNAVMPQMDIVGLAAYGRKKYDYSLFNSELLGGNFTWMIMKTTGPQKQFFDLMLDKYQLQETINRYNIYQYKP